MILTHDQIFSITMFLLIPLILALFNKSKDGVGARAPIPPEGWYNLGGNLYRLPLEGDASGYNPPAPYEAERPTPPPRSPKKY